MYKDLLNTKKRVFLVLDIDDTVLFSRIGKKFANNDICELIDVAYEYMNIIRIYYIPYKQR